MTRHARTTAGIVLMCVTAHSVFGQGIETRGAGRREASTSAETASSVLSPGEWQRVDGAVDRGLVWLAGNQQSDGSFPSLDLGQPGVTGLCVLAFMSHGHVPGEGRYGEQLSRAIDFIAAAQKANGLITVVGPDGPTLSRSPRNESGVTAAYNHAISSLVLSESYGMSDAARTGKTRRAINKALRRDPHHAALAEGSCDRPRRLALFRTTTTIGIRTCRSRVGN